MGEAVPVGLGHGLAGDGLDQPPELVARIGVVLAGGERGLARQAAEDQNAGVRIRDRREGGFQEGSPWLMSDRLRLAALDSNVAHLQVVS